MPFQKGHGATKPKGTKNRKTQLVEDTAAALGCNPFEILCLFANGDWKKLGYDNECYFVEKPDGATRMGYTIPPELRAKCAADACKYLYSQKRTVDVTGIVATPQVNDEEEIQRLMAEYKKAVEMK